MMSDYRYSIIVTCSDSYYDLIEGFIYFFEKNFPDKNVPVFFSMETKSFDYTSSQFTYHFSNRKNWSENLFDTLRLVQTDYVCVLMDDYWLFNEADMALLDEVINFSTEHRIDHISYLDKSNNYFHKLELVEKRSNIEFYECHSGQYGPNYLIGVGGVYNVSILKKILRRWETAWEFETEASRRYSKQSMQRNYRFTNVNNPFNYLYGGIIEKGKIRDSAINEINNLPFKFQWVNQRIKVSTNKTPVLIRALRKVIRPFRRLVNNHFGKME
jgi:hypothetical protein